MRGKNAVIVAQTGAGKTLMSAMVIKQLLTENAQPGLVIYLEKMRHMVVQAMHSLHGTQ